MSRIVADLRRLDKRKNMCSSTTKRTGRKIERKRRNIENRKGYDDHPDVSVLGQLEVHHENNRDRQKEGTGLRVSRGSGREDDVAWTMGRHRCTTITAHCSEPDSRRICRR